MSIKHDLPALGVDFINHLKTQGSADNTIINYTQKIHDLFIFLIKHKQVAGELNSIDDIFIKDITIQDLNSFLAYVSDKYNNSNKKYSNSTKANYVACIKSFFKYITIQVLTDMNNPSKNLVTPKIDKTIPQYLNIEEVDKLLNSIADEKYYAIMVLFLNCGLRLSDIVNLQIDDISFDSFGHKITIRKGKGGVDRVIYLSDNCIDAITRYKEVRLESSCNNLFVHKRNGVKPYSESGIQSIVIQCITNAEVNPKAHTHSLRHTFASIAVANDVDVKSLQKILGHSDIKTTDRYIQNFEGSTSKVAQLVNLGRSKE